MSPVRIIKSERPLAVEPSSKPPRFVRVSRMGGVVFMPNSSPDAAEQTPSPAPASRKSR